MQLVVYSRPDCHLCDVMCGRLKQLQQEHAFSFDIIDVDSDIEYKKRYGLLIPVLVILHVDQSQEVLCHYHLDEALLLERLNKAKGE